MNVMKTTYLIRVVLMNVWIVERRMDIVLTGVLRNVVTVSAVFVILLQKMMEEIYFVVLLMLSINMLLVISAML